MRGGFLNRAEELGMLERRWEAGEGQIFLLWGRRRVGKTELLLEFGREKKTLFFEATSGTRADHLGDFSERLAEVSGRGAGLVAADWRAALDAVGDWAAAEGPVLMVLDEFQHIARESPEIGTEINVWWRERGASLPLFAVLSGSEVGFFEREVVSYSASTYGRRAGQLRLEPFRPRDIGLFLPGWRVADRIRAYGVFGNMPYYLAHVREDADLAENILDLILMRDGLLHEEARLLLDAELPDASAYFSVLRAIAAGQTRVSQIDSRTGIGDTSRVSQMLDRLQRRRAGQGGGSGGAPAPRRPPARLSLLALGLRAIAARRGDRRPEAQPGRGRGGGWPPSTSTVEPAMSSCSPGMRTPARQ
jgi:AAA+ ATPase superfamily predicted ATPase